MKSCLPKRPSDFEPDVAELCGRPAAIVSFLRGQWPRRITPEHCLALGEAMARLHIAGMLFDMTRANDLSLAGWRALFDARGGRGPTCRGSERRGPASGPAPRPPGAGDR